MSGTDIIRDMIAAISGIPAEQIPLDSNLYLNVGVASVHALQLLGELEQRFKIIVPDDEFVEATSVESLGQLVTRLIGEQHSGPEGIPSA
jgi:acyl carrier protein